MKRTGTKYIGIYRLLDHDGHWWVQDDNGYEEYCGRTRPTDEQVDAFRDYPT